MCVSVFKSVSVRTCADVCCRGVSVCLNVHNSEDVDVGVIFKIDVGFDAGGNDTAVE